MARPVSRRGGQGWFLAFGGFQHHVKFSVFKGTSFKPVPPIGQFKNVRSLDVRESDKIDEKQLATWIRISRQMFNTLKLTSRCDSLYEKWGEQPSVPFQMGPNESAAEYWQGKTLVANDVNQVFSISPDLAALENADPAKQKSWALALQSLTENLDKVTSPFQADGKTPSRLLKNHLVLC